MKIVSRLFSRIVYHSLLIDNLVTSLGNSYLLVKDKRYLIHQWIVNSCLFIRASPVSVGHSLIRRIVSPVKMKRTHS